MQQGYFARYALFVRYPVFHKDFSARSGRSCKEATAPALKNSEDVILSVTFLSLGMCQRPGPWFAKDTESTSEGVISTTITSSVQNEEDFRVST